MPSANDDKGHSHSLAIADIDHINYVLTQMMTLSRGIVIVWLSLISTTWAYTPECTNCRCCVGKCDPAQDGHWQCHTGCNDGYWGQECQYRCPVGCANTCTQYPSKSGDPECYTCKVGYYSKQDSLTCNGNCPYSCSKCIALKNCTSCKDSYFSHEGDPTCRGRCPNECVSCSSSRVCTECQPGYYKSETKQDCSLSCQPSCSACSSATDCTACRDGHYSDGKGACTPCPIGCSVCTGPGQCSSCRPSFKGDSCAHCIDGNYGEDCSSSCPSSCSACSSATHCNACREGYYSDGQGGCSLCPTGCASCTSNSQCTTCKSGFTGTRCDSCLAGKYGNNCDQDCIDHCKTCSSSYTCDVCHNEFTGDMCEECKAGRYGTNCRSTCPSTCRDNICQRNDGLCTACWDDSYLLHGKCYLCIKNCGSCTESSKCLTCKSGFTGTRCESCVVGKHGKYCDHSCPNNCETCSSNAKCLQCKHGFYNGRSPDGRYIAYDCRYSCPASCTSCTSYTECTECKSALLAGDTCQNCVARQYGTHCEHECPTNCQNKICGRNTGNCRSCVHNFEGNICDQCIGGKYGVHCNVHCRKNCKNNRCERSNGLCIACQDGYYSDTLRICSPCPMGCALCSSPSKCSRCKTGFMGTSCDRCVPGKFGNNCNLQCPSSCQTCSALSNCQKCKNGYYKGISPRGVSVVYNDCRHRCPASCSSCTSHTHCKACRNGYKGGACEKCTDGRKHGTTCTNWCSLKCLNRLCDRDTGNCLSCPPGFTGNKCDMCVAGRYGGRCNQLCSSNCKNKRCRRYGGHCTDGCINDSFHGGTCAKPCSSNCKNDKCKQYTAHCINGCINNNLHGDLCDTCIIGFYNKTCLTPCSVNCQYNRCKKSDGRCTDGCKGGYGGDFCNYCANGKYGDKCDRTCPANCLNGKCDSRSGNCGACERGFYGINCTEQCSASCKYGICLQDNGTCSSGCKAGYSGDRCCIQGDNCLTCSSNDKCAICVRGWYGDKCNQQCPDNCTDAGCNKNDGGCLSCEGQSYGTKCENKCPINCLQNETMRRCDEKAGHCIGQCVQGYHGEMCNRSCSLNCNNQTCSKDGVTCLLGCVQGQTGTTCAEEEPGPGPNAIGLAIGVVVALGFIILIVAGALVICRRRRGGDKANGRSPKRGTRMEMSNVRISHRSSVTDRTESRVQVDVLGGSGEEMEDEVGNDVIDDVSDATYANVGGIRKRIAVVELREYVASTPRADLTAEFKVLPKGLTKSVAVSKLPKNNARNRYANIYPYDESRVKLTGRFTSSDYINASYIRGHDKERAYIASLGPTHAVMKRFEIFWDMVWQEKVEKIVMLTNLVENRQMKCEQYWPDVNSTLTYGRVTVINLHEDVNADYVVRNLSVSMGSRKRTVSQVHFTAWPDKNVPDQVTSIVEVHNRVKSLKHELNGPILVHCSAGIGRTGTYIALDILTEEGGATGHVDVYNCVMALRQQRVNMVQTEKQYVYLHNAVAHELTFENKPVRADEFQETTAKTTDQDFDNKFQRLSETMESAPEEEELARNKNKTFNGLNRKSADIPGDRYRVRLFEFQTRGDHDYINAVYINSFKTINRFIAAQTPLPATVQDFIKMILQTRCTCVVNLEPETLRIKTIGKYLPPDNQTLTHGQFQLSSTKLISPEAYTVRQITIRVKNSEKETVVQCFQFNSWPSKETVPNDPTTFVRFIKDVTDKAKELEVEGDISSILLHCLSGATKCGLFCVVYNAMEKIDNEQEVSIENIMRQIQARRRAAFPNKDQLAFCYRAVSAYLELFNVYTNFEMRSQ